jgi:hypothetical protein
MACKRKVKVSRLAQALSLIIIHSMWKLLQLPLLALLCQISLTSLVSGVEIVEGPLIETTDTTAKITWKTDVECGTRVRYGLSATQLIQKSEGGVGLLHEVLLTSLQAGTTYHYSVGTARYALQTGTFTTGGKSASPPPPSESTKPAVTEFKPLPKFTTPEPVPTATPTPPAKSESWFSKLLPKLSNPAPAPAPTPKRTAPPTRQTWGNIDSLEDHYERHGRDFHATSEDDYARQAWEFLQRAIEEGLPAKYDEEDGTYRVYDPKTGAFAAYNRSGRTKTYFKPGSPGYFQRQPGKLIKIKRL